MIKRFNKSVEELLLKAGWFEGRQWSGLSQVIGPDVPDAARCILAEFGWLRMGKVGPGLEHATSDLDLDPTKGDSIADSAELQQWCKANEKTVFPLGEAHRGQGVLLVDESGNIYLYGEGLFLVARNFDDALEVLLMGHHTHELQL